MRLTDLIDGYKGKENPEISGLTVDSRRVQKKYLFAALKGERMDGRDFIEDAVYNGASVILSHKGTKVPDGVILIESDDPRYDFAMAAARFHNAQPHYIAAVTGTNGKTSCVDFALQIWQALGVKAASLGTLGVRGGGMVRASSMTTPDAEALHATLADLAGSGVQHLAMEASSHGLDQHRLSGVKVSVAAFTSFSQDHLDYHGTMENYLSAKLRLFTDLLKEDGIAVLNADIPEFEAIAAAVKSRQIEIIDYGRNAKALKIKARETLPTGQKLSLDIQGQDFDITLPLVGDFQIMNALCAFGMVIAQNKEDTKFVAQAAEALEHLKGVPGRLQYVDRYNGAAIYVDYAHTPDALSQILDALRPHTAAKLHCLIGCGGDRDMLKRPIMGRIASEKADIAIITDDNPRGEDPSKIRSMMVGGVAENLKSKVVEIEGRGAAIYRAVQNLSHGDILVIAGKGHEQGQIIAGRTMPFDDVQEAHKAVLTLSQKHSKAHSKESC